MPTHDYAVIVIGGGAAGLFCAGQLGQAGLPTLVLEANARVGAKIRISGGGRCNFTNLAVSAQNFLCENPHFAKSALARYSPQDFIALVDSYGIDYYEKTLGQLFCRGSAQEMIDLLLEECRRGEVTILTEMYVDAVSWDRRFVVSTPTGTFHAAAVVVATGGLSIPPLGVSDIGYRIARSFGHRVVEPRPGLTPLTLDTRENAALLDLAGVSFPVVARTGEASFAENLLITHRGLSGPAVLQASNYWRPNEPLVLDLLPGNTSWDVDSGARSTLTQLARRLPKRFCSEYLAPALGPLCDVPVARLTAPQRRDITERLSEWTLHPNGTEGFRKAEVTLGGVSVEQISSKTMESQRRAGLYFVGEVLDVTGWLGGYNFQWAWSSAAATARALSGQR